MRAMSSRLKAIGAASDGANGSADADSVRQPCGDSGAICAPPFHGTSVDALRPAWASWIATGIGDHWRMASTTRAIAVSLASE